jgi:hypothetical protein
MHKLTFAAAALLFALVGCGAQPTTYEDVARLPPDEQLAVFKAANPVEKAAIYRGHLAHYADRPGLTEAQRAACRHAASLISEVDYWPHDTPEWKARAADESDERGIREAFGDDAKLVLYSLD